MSHPGLRARFEPSSMALWLTVAALLAFAASCAGTRPTGRVMTASRCAAERASTRRSIRATAAAATAPARAGSGARRACASAGRGRGAWTTASTGGAGGELCPPASWRAAAAASTSDTRRRPLRGLRPECAAEQRWEAGACRCASGLTECGARLRGRGERSAALRSCEARCPFHETRVEGACLCDERFAVCGGRCVDWPLTPAALRRVRRGVRPGAALPGGRVRLRRRRLRGHRLDGPAAPEQAPRSARRPISLACMAPGSTEFVYRFTAEEAGRYRSDTARSSYDTAIGVLDFDACEELACTTIAGEPRPAALGGPRGRAERPPRRLGLRRRARRLRPSRRPGGAAGVPARQHRDGSPADDHRGHLGARRRRLDALRFNRHPRRELQFHRAARRQVHPRHVRPTFDTVLELRRGSCSGAMIACNDNGDDNAMEAETSRIVE